MDKISGIPPAQYATERLEHVETNLRRLAENVNFSVDETLRLSMVQAEMANAAAILDLAAALRESNADKGPRDC